MRRNGSVLVIDDEEIMREILETLLDARGLRRCALAPPGRKGSTLRARLPFDAAIVDVMMPGMDGLAGARRAQEARRRPARHHDHRVRVGGDRDRGDEARRLRLHHQAVQERRGARRPAQRHRAPPPASTENRALRRTCRRGYHQFADIIGRSPRMRQVFDLIIQAAPSRSTDPDPGRERHGQGTRGAGDPHELAARRPGRSSRSTRATCRPTCSSRTCSGT